jgi:aspartyl protease family protein
MGLLAAAVIALLATPAEAPLFGLSHDEFARGAFGCALLLWLFMSGLARAGPGAARVFSGVAMWALIGVTLVGAYTFRAELAEMRDRVLSELGGTTAQVGPSGEVTIRRRLDGEYIVPGRVNDRPVSFVFDTGASSVVLSAEDAAAAGLSPSELDYGVPVTTANGATTAALTRIDRIAIGPIVVRGVQALVTHPGVLRRSLLGMSFLERLKSYGVEGGKLVFKGR